MPYVNIKVTGGSQAPTRHQKVELIAGVTDLMIRVLNKNPASTVVVIEEVPADNWGLNGKSATERAGELPSRPEE